MSTVNGIYMMAFGAIDGQERYFGVEELASRISVNLPEILKWSAKVISEAGAEDFTKEIQEELDRVRDLSVEKKEPSSSITTDNIPQSVLDEVKSIRLAGQLPYYLAKAVGCWFAIKNSDKVCPDTVGEVCNMKYEVQFNRQVADACNDILDKKFTLENPKRVALLKKAYEAGYHNEKANKGCGQCTLSALFDVIGNKNPQVFKMANTLSAGMGMFGDGACGGYSGGLLYLGNYAGRRLEFADGDEEQKKLAMRLCELFHRKYIDTYGTVICHGIHCDIFGRAYRLRKPDEKNEFEEMGAHTIDKCPAVVGTAAMWVVEILLDEGYITID